MSQGSCHKLPLSKFRNSSNQKPKPPPQKNTPKLSLFYNAPAKSIVTFKIYISRNKSCLKYVQERPHILHIFLHRELCLRYEKHNLMGFYLQNYITRRAPRAQHHHRQCPRALTQNPAALASVLKGSTFTGFSNEFL